MQFKMRLSHLLSINIVSHLVAAIAPQKCHDFVIISTRGTNEPQGPSVAFPGMINTTLSSVEGGVEYDTVYPAGEGTENLGAMDILRYINNGVLNCPQQVYALLGYSQGAAAVVLSLQNITRTDSAAYKAVKAVIVVGNPIRKAFESANVDQFNGTSNRDFFGVLWNNVTFPPSTWYTNDKLVDICHTGDLVCEGIRQNATWDDHLKYGITPGVQEIGAQWMISRLREPEC